MKVLILSCNTGQGHNSVSQAVQEAFEARGVPCRTADSLSFLSQRASSFICGWHVRIYRYLPSAMRAGYRYTEGHPGVYDEKTLIYRFLASGADRLWEFVQEVGYDCFVCPHVISGLMLTRMLREHPLPGAKSCFIATDYTCGPLVNESALDWYFTPDAATVPDFAAAGIPAEKVVPVSGIPVRSAFYERVPQREARARLGLPETGRQVLMMGGSMGCGPLDELAQLLLGALPEGCGITAVCGTNERLYKKLTRAFSGEPRLRVLGFTQEIPLLMDSADLFLTKPGGLSTSEAAVKGLPLVLDDVVSGCEEPNLRYFCACGGARTASAPQELAALCASLLADPETLAAMSRSLLRPGRAADEIAERMLREQAR